MNRDTYKELRAQALRRCKKERSLSDGCSLTDWQFHCDMLRSAQYDLLYIRACHYPGRWALR